MNQTTAAGTSFFVGATGVAARHVVPPVVERAGWLRPRAYVGDTARFEVVSRHVGDGAPVAVEVVDMGGSRIHRSEGTIAAGRFHCDVLIPLDLPLSTTAVMARVRLPRHDLEESALLAIDRPVVIDRLEWSRESAGHGSSVRLSGLVHDPEAGAAGVQVYRAGPDGVDEPVGDPFAVALDRGRLDADWLVPDASVLDHRGEPLLFFRITVRDSRASPPSTHLRVTAVQPADPR